MDEAQGANEPNERFRKRQDQKSKWEKLTTIFDSIKLYLEKRGVRQLPVEYEAETMEEGAGRKRRAKKCIGGKK